MCELNEKLDKKFVVGYKIVAEKKIKPGEYYSVAMGFKYRKDGKVQIPKKQKRILFAFYNGILTVLYNREEYAMCPKFGGFRENLLGRTAIFKRKRDALYVSGQLCSSPMDTRFKCLIKKAKVSEDLMSGTWKDCEIVAGRHIEFLE